MRATSTTIQTAFRVMVMLSAIPDAWPNGFPFSRLATAQVGMLPSEVTPSPEGEQAAIREEGYKTSIFSPRMLAGYLP